jgi:hypothetical protein
VEFLGINSGVKANSDRRFGVGVIWLKGKSSNSDISCLLIFTQLPKQTINQLLHHDRKLAIKRKAAVVVTQTDLIL